MKEIGVIWSDDRTSTVSPFKSSVRFFKDIGFIKRHTNHYFFDPNNQNKKGEGKWVIALMISLLLLVVAAFVVFLILKAQA